MAPRCRVGGPASATGDAGAGGLVGVRVGGLAGSAAGSCGVVRSTAETSQLAAAAPGASAASQRSAAGGQAGVCGVDANAFVAGSWPTRGPRDQFRAGRAGRLAGLGVRRPGAAELRAGPGGVGLDGSRDRANRDSATGPLGTGAGLGGAGRSAGAPGRGGAERGHGPGPAGGSGRRAAPPGWPAPGVPGLGVGFECRGT